MSSDTISTITVSSCSTHTTRQASSNEKQGVRRACSYACQHVCMHTFEYSCSSDITMLMQQ